MNILNTTPILKGGIKDPEQRWEVGWEIALSVKSLVRKCEDLSLGPQNTSEKIGCGCMSCILSTEEVGVGRGQDQEGPLGLLDI